jgi:hypothetical protein
MNLRQARSIAQAVQAGQSPDRESRHIAFTLLDESAMNPRHGKRTRVRDLGLAFDLLEHLRERSD